MKDKAMGIYCYGEINGILNYHQYGTICIIINIRIGLINVSTLPRPNFIIVDEVWKNLDSDNITNIQEHAILENSI